MRVVLGVAAGGAAVLAAVALPLIVLFLTLGPDRALVGETLEFSTMWIGIAMVVCLGAAVLGGWLAHRVSGSVSAVAALAGVVLLLGLADAGWHHLSGPPLPVTIGELGLFQVLSGLREPAWYDWTLPLLMATFVWVAGSGRATEHP